VNAGKNGTEACRMLGIKEPNAKQKAWKLRHMPHIQQLLAELEANAQYEAGVSRTFVLTELRKVAAYEEPDQFSAKVGALRTLAQSLSMLNEKVELTGSNGGPVNHVVQRIERVIVDPQDTHG
jgi:hypothetical protein